MGANLRPRHPAPSASQLQRREDLLEVFEGFPDSVFVTDGNGKVIMANRVSKTMTGTGAEDVLGENVFDLEARGLFFPSVTRMTLEDGQPHTALQTVANGKYILVTSNPVKDSSGRIVKIVTASRDVSTLMDEACCGQEAIQELKRLRADLERARIETAHLRREIRKLKGMGSAPSGIVARSPVMIQALELAAAVADADATILLTGESGSGKGVLAQYIHEISARAKGPFVKTSCGAIPEPLLESELFGYDPGSFTGARREGKIGLIEAAHGGTVFLDEIADLSSSVQVKLLYVLQEKKVLRIGRVDPVPVDVRFIAATNADLDSLVKQGLFRRDLYYRLNVIPITIPPLRDRSDDIPLLAHHFLDAFNERYGKRKSLSPEAVSALQEYDWPGNVRELENLMERLVVTAKEDEIVLEHLPKRVTGSGKNHSHDAVCVSRVVPLKNALDETERQLIGLAIAQHGSMRAAARALEVNVSTVSRKVTAYARRCSRATP